MEQRVASAWTQLLGGGLFQCEKWGQRGSSQHPGSDISHCSLQLRSQLGRGRRQVSPEPFKCSE